MIKLLEKIFIHDNMTPEQKRSRSGMLCGLLGIALNLCLFAAKLTAGTLSGSIAITADAFNNLSDAGSSIISLLGFKLAEQKPDQAHPFGHGRIEYLSGFIVSVLIVVMGIELARDSIDAILHPQLPQFSITVVVILALSVVVKLYMFLYNRSVGKRIGSSALTATATDSLSDAAATSAVLISLVAAYSFELLIDGWCGALVAGFILYSGIRSAIDTISPLLGQPPEPEFIKKIEELVLSHEEVKGLHDLVVHNYGPGRQMISLHAEVSASQDALVTHDAIDNIERELRRALGCEAVIHMDPIADDDEATARSREQTLEAVRLIDPRITIHDFRMVTGPTHTNLIFDAVVPYDCGQDDETLKSRIAAQVNKLDDSLYTVVNIDRSYTG